MSAQGANFVVPAIENEPMVCAITITAGYTYRRRNEWVGMKLESSATKSDRISSKVIGR